MLSDVVNVGNIKVGDCFKYYANSDMASGFMIQMGNNGLLQAQIDEENKTVDLSVVNTMLEMEESITTMNHDQIVKVIKCLKELEKRIK